MKQTQRLTSDESAMLSIIVNRAYRTGQIPTRREIAAAMDLPPLGSRQRRILFGLAAKGRVRLQVGVALTHTSAATGKAQKSCASASTWLWPQSASGARSCANGTQTVSKPCVMPGAVCLATRMQSASLARWPRIYA